MSSFFLITAPVAFFRRRQKKKELLRREREKTKRNQVFYTKNLPCCAAHSDCVGLKPEFIKNIKINFYGGGFSCRKCAGTGKERLPSGESRVL